MRHSTGPVSIDVLDRRLVPPGDLIDGQIEHAGDLFAFGRAGCPAGHENGGHTAFIKPGLLDKLRKSDVFRLTQFGDAFNHFFRPLRRPGVGPLASETIISHALLNRKADSE